MRKAVDLIVEHAKPIPAEQAAARDEALDTGEGGRRSGVRLRRDLDSGAPSSGTPPTARLARL